MKKLLALVLALVMTLGLATVGANAAYADADDINYKEAVDVMSAIGVLAGDETGFRPADTLKRSEGAKIVAYLIAGNKTAEAMQGTGTKYTDLPANHWAAGYMEYLTAIGVMGGVGDGKIDPDGQLTATAFAKMLLVALGYDAEIEGFGGSDWAINVQKVANTVGLFDGNRAVVGSAAVTREEAALYAFNTIMSPLVEYGTVTTVNVGGAEVKVGGSKAEKVTKDTTYSNNIDDDEIDDVDVIEFAEEYYRDLVLVGQDYQLDDLGRPMREWTFNNVEVGTYVAETGRVATLDGKVTAKQLYELLGKATYDSLRSATFSAATLPTAGTVLISHVNGVNSEDGDLAVNETKLTTSMIGERTSNTADPDDIEAYLSRTNTTTVNGTGNGSVTEVFMDADRNVYLATYYTYLYQAVGDYNATKETVTLTQASDSAPLLTDNKLDVADFPEIADFKDGDYILVTVSKATATRYDVQTVAKAELLTGTVDQYQYESTFSVTIDGTKYSYSLTADNDTKGTMYTVGQKATVVLDQKGYVIAVDQAVVTSDYVFVEEWGSSSNLAADARAKVIFADGTSGEVNVKSAWDYDAGTPAQVTAKGTIAGWAAATNANRWYTFSKDASNNYTFYAAESKYNQINHKFTWADAATYDDGTYVKVSVNNVARFLNRGTQLANDNTIVLVSDADDDVTIYTGVKNIPNTVLNATGATATAYVLYNKSSNYATLAYIDLDGDADVLGGAGEELIYVIKYKAATRTTDNDVFYTYTTLEGADEVDVEADTKIAIATGNYYDAAYYASKNAKGQLINFRAMPTNTQAGSVIGYQSQTGAISYSDGTLKIAGRSYTVNDDTKISLIVTTAALKRDTAKAYEVANDISAKVLADTLKGYGITYKVAGKLTSTTSNTLSELYVTVTNAVASSNLTASATAAGTAAQDDTDALETALGTANANITAKNDFYLDDGDDNSTVSVAAGQTVTFTDDLTVVAGQTLNIAGDVVVQGDLNVPATAIINVNTPGSLTVNGTITIGGTVTLDGANATLTVNGTTGNTIGGASLHVKNGASAVFAGSVDVTGKLEIQSTGGTVTVGNELTVTGGDVDVYGGALEAEELTLTSGTVDTQNTAQLVVNEDLTVNGGTLTNASTNTNNGLKVGGDLVANDGTVTNNGTADVAGEITKDEGASGSTVDGSNEINTGTVTLSGSLTIASDVTYENVVVEADTAISGEYTITITGTLSAEDSYAITGDATIVLGEDATIDVADGKTLSIAKLEAGSFEDIDTVVTSSKKEDTESATAATPKIAVTKSALLPDFNGDEAFELPDGVSSTALAWYRFDFSGVTGFVAGTSKVYMKSDNAVPGEVQTLDDGTYSLVVGNATQTVTFYVWADGTDAGKNDNNLSAATYTLEVTLPSGWGPALDE